MKKLKYFIAALAMLLVPTIVKAEEFKVGDYVEMTPTKTSYTLSAEVTGDEGVFNTLNPSELTLWRIIEIHSDGSFDAVSEYVSSKAIRLYGPNGYAYAIRTFQQIAKQYENGAYTTGSRMMGYDGQTEAIINTSDFDGSNTTPSYTTSTPSPTTGTGEEYNDGAGGDTLYLKDYNLVGSVYKNDEGYGDTGLVAYRVDTKIESSYWLASRQYRWNSENRYMFECRTIGMDGNFAGNGDYIISYSRNDEDHWYYSNLENYRVRPILTFKKSLYIESGEGSKTSPYKLTTANPNLNQDSTGTGSTTNSNTSTGSTTDSGKSSTSKTGTKESVENPKTGVESSIRYIISGTLFIGALVLVIKKYGKLKRI